MLEAKLVLQELIGCGVTHVVSLPDNSSAGLLALLREDGRIRLVSVTREGEAFAIAAGLWIGGATPVVLVQNTGFLESGDSYRGTALRMRIPLLCLITFRGYAKLSAETLPGTPEHWHADQFSRPDMDSAALMTVPTLKAWGLPHDLLHSHLDLPKIRAAAARAAVDARPVALLVTGEMS
jgi:sulfopyruvate decarboxylase subunit alpha